ncbi:MAG: MBL fold metallo-hydrolase [Candidatus Zixiibacteriota bacterium]
MRLMTLASGSSGNSSLVEIDGLHILIDCGIGAKKIVHALQYFGVSPYNIDAIILTHEHNDHVRGVDVFARRYSVPVYLSMKLYTSSKRLYFTEHSEISIRPFFTESPFHIGNVQILPFSVPHDVIDPVGFRIEGEGVSIGYATDIGHLTPDLFEYCSGVEYLVIEANHDVEMLDKGPYPDHLKRRIIGELGHLSNADTKIALDRLYHPKLRHVVLVHLSKINNSPEKALEAMGDLRYDLMIDTAPRFEPVDWTIGEVNHRTF